LKKANHNSKRARPYWTTIKRFHGDMLYTLTDCNRSKTGELFKGSIEDETKLVMEIFKEVPDAADMTLKTY
jgi:hypothetical protein